MITLNEISISFNKLLEANSKCIDSERLILEFKPINTDKVLRDDNEYQKEIFNLKRSKELLDSYKNQFSELIAEFNNALSDILKIIEVENCWIQIGNRLIIRKIGNSIESFDSDYQLMIDLMKTNPSEHKERLKIFTLIKI